MPRYFFHLHDRIDIIDTVGTVLPSVREALDQAVISAGESIRELGDRFWVDRDWTSWVVDESGATVCTVKFTGTLTQASAASLGVSAL